MSPAVMCDVFDLAGSKRTESRYHEVVVWKPDILKNTQTTTQLYSERFRKEGERLFPNLPPLLNGHSDVHLRNGIMNAFGKSAVQELNAEKAFFVADLSEVYRQFKRWKICFPEILPFYAIKCNPDPYVLRLLAALGAGFDCASTGEISQVLDIGGVDPSRIIYANPCKAASFIRNAAKRGVDLMTFDNTDELYKIARAHPNAKLVVRILTDDSKSLCALGVKFGAPLSAVPELLAKAKELHLEVVGVSFHVGSGCYDASVYSDAIMRARTAFDMGKEAGYAFKLLDVGGGFGDALFEEVAQVLNQAIDTHFPDRTDLKIIGEPGRYFVSKAFRLATNVIARRGPLSDTNPTNDQGELVMFYINEGVYGAFNCVLFDHQEVHPYVLSMNGSFHVTANEPMVSCSIWGPTCDSMDRVCVNAELPLGLRVGDWLGFDDMGAYTICAASRFNGFELSNVIYTSGSGIEGSELRSVLARFAEDTLS